MRREIKALLLLFLFMLTGVEVSSASTDIHAPLKNASEVITAINNYRQQSGTHALSENSILMSLAQGQSNYQASTGNITHTGSGGTKPIDRAYAAGYGDGNKIFLSEIIFGGYKVTVDDALSWWKGSSLHNRVMLDSQYLEIGAGVTTDGDWTYITAEIAWVTGISAPVGSGEGESNGDTGESQGDFVTIPVTIIKATPNEDGSIIHIIQEGQTLWAIAAVYNVDLDTLIKQNNLTRTSYVFPGDEIIVQPAGSLSSTPKPVDQVPSGESTHEGAKPQSIGEAVSFSATASPTKKSIYTPTSEATSIPEESIENPSVQWVIILSFAIIFIVVVGSLFIQKQPDRPSDDGIVR
jgi:LysM repeat protein